MSFVLLMYSLLTIMTENVSMNLCTEVVIFVISHWEGNDILLILCIYGSRTVIDTLILETIFDSKFEKKAGVC